MALLFMDGFDHVGNSIDLANNGKWGPTSFLSLIGSSAQSRTGGFSANANSSSYNVTTRVLPASGGFIVGVAVYVTRTVPLSDDFLRVKEGSTTHLQLAFTSARLLQVKHGSGSTLATGTTVIPNNTWVYLEFQGVIHDSAGSYELRVDGVTELTASTLDTRNGATGQWDRIYVNGVGGTGEGTYFDDLYICDTSGAAPRNTFLGPCKVETLLPQTDAVAAGSNAGLTPSTSTDHGALVDEAAANTSDYNSSATVGAKDTYNYPPLSLSGAVLGIQTTLYVAKSDSGARSVCAVVRAGGTDYDGATVAPLTTFSYFPEVLAQNPNTSADWTTSDLATLQAGMKVTA